MTFKTRATVICPSCSNDRYEATISYDYETETWADVWRCGNCSAETPRHTRKRKSNLEKSLELYDVLKAEYAPVDAAIDAAIDAGTVKAGWALAYGSFNCYGFNILLEGFKGNGKISNRDLEYAAEQTREAIKRETEKLAEVGVTV